jgi:ferredoxin
MHYSQQHEYDGTPGQGPSPLTGGPNGFLLRQPVNAMCLGCHNGQTFAPDVFAANTNAIDYVQGRQGGGLNAVGETEGEGYEGWMGHTLESTDTPPGGTWVNPGLECVHCHQQHGRAISGINPYRNLNGTRGGAANAALSYKIDTAEDNTTDVRINLAAYTAGSGNAATFAPYYSFANVFFNEPDTTSSKYAVWCGGCHTDFANNGMPVQVNEEFLRHPTMGVDIGLLGGGHSNFTTRYKVNTTRVQTLTADHTYQTQDVSPSCMSCHKAHGNKNPFGLFFLNRTSTSVDDEGGWAAGQTHDTGTGYRNLCGQCHSQGN